MTNPTHDSDDDRLAELSVSWEDSWDHGIELTPEELCADCPHLLQPLRERIAALKEMAWLKQDLGTTQPSELDPPLTGLLASRYRIEGLLGEGGHGRVYRALDEELRRPVAIKLAHDSRNPVDLLNEARRVAQLRHPGLVAVHDVGRHENRLFVVSDLIEGQSLAELLAGGRLPLREAVRISAEVAEALHFAHEQGFVHRDIKPANILLGSDRHPLITDFGIAITQGELGSRSAASIGTLSYMAPEQVAGESQLIDRRTDVYALGVVLFELLTGRSPYQARTPLALREQILFRQPLALRAADAALPAALETICSRCLAKHPADRHEAASTLAAELRSWLTPKDKQRSSTWMMIALALCLLIVGGAVAFQHLPQLNLGSPFVRDGAIHFGGRTRIVTPVVRTLPVTLEAWVRPDAYTGTGCQFVIGSDVPTKYGVGIGICGSVLSAEYLSGMLNSAAAVPPGEWSHIAGVFTETETRLYLNGVLVHSGPGGKSADSSTKFVIGDVGLTNPIAVFHGDMRAIRISSGERYTADFTPSQKFAPDHDALAVYSAKSIDGRTLRDISGQQNDASVEIGAK